MSRNEELEQVRTRIEFPVLLIGSFHCVVMLEMWQCSHLISSISCMHVGRWTTKEFKHDCLSHSLTVVVLC